MDTIETPQNDHSPVGQSYAKVTLGTTQPAGPQEAKILGVRWNPQTDQLIISTCDIT